MPIFKTHGKKLHKLSTVSIKKEKDLQTLVEENLLEVLDMHFLATEYTTTFGGRIDTLAVDSSGAPVIIEYKRNKNDNVINQGLSYLRWLQAQKIEFFEMLLIKRLGEDIAKTIKIDWKNPRVVCIAESYSKFDIDTVEVVPMRIELLKYRLYQEGIFSLEQVGVREQKSTQVSASQPGRIQSETTVDDLLAKASPVIKDLFGELRSRIIEMDENIIEKATAFYVAFRVSKNFAEVHIGKNQLKIHLRPIDYEDPKGRVDKIPEGYNWTMDRRVYLKNESDLEYVLGLIEQSHSDVL
ncbi:MAG: DUF5655 domain-containing protein [Candidatus Marinimicrobia bacterium]|nr:DUF5655 domain-containing protein [Candidatus Neomarinimicrobiota bacterium]